MHTTQWYQSLLHLSRLKFACSNLAALWTGVELGMRIYMEWGLIGNEDLYGIKTYREWRFIWNEDLFEMTFENEDYMGWKFIGNDDLNGMTTYRGWGLIWNEDLYGIRTGDSYGKYIYKEEDLYGIRTYREWGVIWVKWRNCGCLVTWFCYQLIAKPGNKTATVSWPDPYGIRTYREWGFVWNKDLYDWGFICNKDL